MKAKRTLFVCLLLSLFLTACGGGGSDSGGGNGDDNDNGGDTPPSTPCWISGGGDGTEGKKLLNKILVEGEESRTFQYDDQNRLISDSALGEGNKIEYEGDSPCPSLVTNGTPYPIWSGYNSSGNVVEVPIVYIRYQYGEDDLLDGIPTKYYQTLILDQGKKTIRLDYADRYYLNSDDREIAYGSYRFSGNVFSRSRYHYITYDERGNLLKWSTTRSCGLACIYSTVSEYVYDGKKGLTSGMATPLWWFANGSDGFSGNFLANPNNLLSYTVTSTYPGNNVKLEATETYGYTYDQGGYPAAVDVTGMSRDNQGVEQTTTYRKIFEYIPAH